MRTNLLNDLSNVVKKGTKLSKKGTSRDQAGFKLMKGESCVVVGLRSGKLPTNHLLTTYYSPTKTSILQHIWKYAAMVTLLLTLACGNVWGTDVSATAFTASQSGSVYTISAKSGSGSLSGVTVTCNQGVTSNLVQFKKNGYLQFSVASGSVITYIKLTYSASDKAPKSTSDITEESSLGSITTVISNPYTTTWTGSAQTVKLLNSSSGQDTRISQIDITYGTSSRKFKSGEKIYFKDKNSTALSSTWKTSTGNLYAYFYNATENAWSAAGTHVAGTLNAADAVYQFTVPGSGKTYTAVIFTRGTAATFESKDGFWNKVADQTPAVGKNLFTVSTSAYDGTWGQYGYPAALVGSFNNWDPSANVFPSEGVSSVNIDDLAASTSYQFKVLQGESFCGIESGTITGTTTSWWHLDGANNVYMTTGTTGRYTFSWNTTTYYLGVYYPGGTLTKNKYIYFDARTETNWTSASFASQFVFKYVDSGSEQSTKWCEKGDALENWVYYTTVPDNDFIGQVKMDRYSAKNGTWWNNSAVIYAYSRANINQNCMVTPSSGGNDITLTWGTYCPPMSSATLSDNSTVKISWQTGDGTSGNPYLVDASGTIKVSASATKAVPDENMTPNYDFKVSDNGASASSAQSGTGTTYDKGSLSNNHTYEISLDAWNSYNETNGTKNTSATHIWYKALTTYSVTHTLSGVTKSTGREGSGAAAYYQPYTATYAASTGYNLPATITVKFGSTTKTAGTDYTWNSSTGELNIPSGKINGDVTIIIDGVAKTTAITLEAGEGGTDGSATATYGTSTITGYEAATRTGYTLGNYYQDGSKNNILTKDGELNSGNKGSLIVGGNWASEDAAVTLYAQWSATSYTLSYDLAGGSVASPNPTSYTIESSAITLNNPTKTGYTFAGWTGTGLAEATTTVTIAAGSTGNRSYTATWTAIVPTSVSLSKSSTTITEGGTETLTATISPAVVADNTITWSTSDADVATVDGGVVTAVAAGTATITATTVNGKSASCEVTVEAAVTYTVTYDAQGGTCKESDTGSSITLPTPTKDDYTFQGWYTSGGELVSSPYNPTADITLHALWRADCAGSGGGGGTLFSQNFNSATEVAYENRKDASLLINKNSSNNIVGTTAASQFTSIAAAKKDKTGIAINTTSGGNSVNASGFFQTYYDNTSGYWSVTKTTDFATTAPTAIKMSMDLYFDTKSSSGSCELVNFAIGDGFSDGLMSTSAQSSSNVHSGWGIAQNSKKICGYTANGTILYNTALSESTWYSITWVINNTGEDLTYDDPDGSGTTTLANDKFDIWLKTQAQTATNYTKVVTAAATTTSKALQELYFGHISGKKNEFRIDNIVVADLTPSSGTCYYVTYNGNGATGGYTKDETAYALNADPTVASNSFTKTGYTFTGWNTLANGTGDPYAAGGTISDISADVTLYAQWAADATTYELTWNTNGGSDLACSGTCTSGDLAYGATIVAPTDPTKSNYTFDGWNTADDGSGSGKASTMPAANTTYYAAWKQTVTLTTGAQGSGGNQTPYVYLNGTGVSSFTAHTASGYTLQGYYTAGSGGTKVLNADGTFAGSNVTDYITSSKWSRTGAAPTLYAQWVASEDCSTSDFVIKKGSGTEYQGCMESTSYDGTATSFTAGSATTVGNAKMTISNYDGGIKRPGSGKTFSIVIEPVSGYYLKSICWAGKVENDETVSYYWDNNSGSATTITPQTTSGTGVTYNAPNSTTTKFTASYVDDGDGSGGIWWRNVQVEVCAAGGATYSVTYDDNGKTGGSVPTDASSPYAYGATVTVLGNTGSLAKTNYTFAGWSTNNDGTGSNYVADNTFSITDDITLYAKWTQAITFDANTANHGSTGGSATAVWNATGLTGITHATPASGYKLLGYYTTDSGDGTKVLNSDGTFAETDVTNYITSGKWSRTGTAPTLYARYEAAGALTWNLSVNTDATSLTTSSKSSAFTEISTSSMSNATLAGELTYEKAKKSSLTGKISTPASYDADKYVYVTFQVASGYKFTPSSIKVIAQPVTTGKDVKLSLTDGASHSLVSSSATSISGGSTQTVTLAGNGTYFEGTVTLKIYCYGATDTYRLGTPITIEGEVEAECETMPSFTRLSYGETSYTVDDTPDNLEVIGGTNISTYLWKQNTTNDRSGDEAASGTNNTATYTPPTSSAGTMYYWCEMTNTDCGITIKTSAVGITVNEDRAAATVTWTNPASTPNYGGGGYTIKATVDQTTWAGAPADLTLSAPEGIRIYNVTRGTTSDQDWIRANFDVQTTFDRTSYSSKIPFVVSADAKTGWYAISDQNDVSYSSCTGAGEGTSYNIRMRKTVTKDSNYYHCANTDGWISPNISSSYSTAKAGTTMEDVFDTVASSNTQYVWVRTYHANVSKVRIYVDFRANDMTVSNVYKHTAYFTANSKYAVEYAAVYNGDEENSNTGTAAQGYVDIILEELMAANDILLVKFNDNKVRPLGAVITESSSGSLPTALSFASTTVNKSQGDASFIQTATRDAAATTSLGAITYSSNNTSVATVNATTGEVTILGAGAATIKATLAASGCYQKAEATYTVNVAEVACTDVAGTVTTEDLGCGIRLTLSGYTEGATIAWYKDGAAITPAETGTTYTATSAGSYYAVTHKECDKASNTVVLADKVVSAERIVEQWYIKNGRVTPDIALWSVGEGTSLSSVAWSPANATGLTAADFYLQDGVIYLKGKSPSSNDSGADIEYTLTLTVTNGCSPTEMSDASKQVTLIHQKNTDKHVLAFVVTGTEKGGFTEGLTAAQTTDVGLYKTIAANFDVQATNCYSTDDEQKVKQYYSQFDILCITDYPNSNTKGVNGKKYVDVLGKLIDTRPILTMEAFVSDKDNWKAKGISGNPKDPTTRQYTMLLQCKDHEIFAGTKLTKVGEGDETMYRVSMVDNTKEDYATLDATYGEGEHAEKTGYAYHTYPALQGFTFGTTMADDGLLPLGLIDDGGGNDLQVGIERQAEMSARLMVLGINSYAMERLTDDGQTVVINALKYLLKKNEEEIADCSIAFYGGTEGHETDWNTDANWKGGMKPDKTAREIRILAPIVIAGGQRIHAQAPIKIASSGTYNGGADNAKGNITIEAGGALIVDGEIKAVTAPAYSKARATEVTDLILKTSGSAQSALILNNDDGDTKATVNLYSLGRKDGDVYQFQYFAVPMSYIDVNPTFAGSGIYTYVWHEASGWERRGYYKGLEAFEGVGITTTFTEAKTYQMKGTLASTEEKEITLTTGGAGAGQNIIGNSWLAPIDIASLRTALDDDEKNIVDKTIYIYCTGNDKADGDDDVDNSPTETAGQWLAIPINAAGWDAWTGLKVIPAMQGFCIIANSDTTLTLNYKDHVRSTASAQLNQKLRAPKRRTEAESEGIDLIRIRVADSKTHTDLYLFEGESFSEEFDNGWEAKYMSGDGRSAKLYAETAIGPMAVVAQPEYEGTVLGFAPGKETEYTFTFSGSNKEYYLNDLKEKKSTLISEDESYMFTFEEGDTNRFYISKTPINAPSVATGTENTGDGVKARKVLVNDKLYIILNGRVYSAEGVMVK